MAGTNIGLKDWLLGWIIPNPTAGSSNTVGIQAVIVVDETGEPIGLRRLLARPTTVYSIEAQERHESRQRIQGK